MSLTVVPLDSGPKASIGGVLMPAHQRYVTQTEDVIVQIDASPPVATNSLVTGARYNFDFAPNQIQKIDSMALRFDISEINTNEMLLCDAAHFIDKIEWQGSLESQPFYTAYGDSLYWEACALPSRIQQNAGYLKELNVSENYGQGNMHPRSKSVSYRLALPGHPFEFMKTFMQNMKKDMRIVITFRNGIIVSGSGTPQLDNLVLEIIQHRVSASDIKALGALNGKMKMHRYLEPIRLQLTSKTLTASTAATFDLDSFSGKFSHLVFGIRADSYAATSNGLIKFVDLGDEATIDFLDASSRSLSNGRAARLSYYKNHAFAHHFDSERFQSNRNLYCIPFSHNIKAAYQGSLMGGFKTFDGSKIKLQITPSAAGTATVHTINVAGSANVGYYKLVFRGESTNSIAYNANAAAIKAALESLRSFKDYSGSPLTVTAGGPATADITLTFDSTLEPPNDVRDLVQMVAESIALTSTADFSDSSVSTYGKKGFTTGSTYSLDIFMWKFKDLFSQDGQIRHADTR